MITLLRGVVGSTAYGLRTDDSDVDRLGIFLAPTEEFLGLTKPLETVVQHAPHPDVTMHEVGKWLSLALKCNPTVTELVWLPHKWYDTISYMGQELINMREHLLNGTGVRNAYFGYATAQFIRLKARGDGSFSSDTRKRTAKHARHLKRLLDQGVELYRSGNLTIELKNPQSYHDFGNRVAEGDLDIAEKAIRDAEDAFNTYTCALRAESDFNLAHKWLIEARSVYL